MPDNLLDVLLGCGCRARCCCGKGQEEAPGPGRTGATLFLQKGRAPAPPRAPDESPFVPPPPPSFDSPQRPAPGHVPRVDAAGAFLASGSVTRDPVLTLDDGTRRELGPTAVHHGERWAEYLQEKSVVQAPPDLRPHGIRSQRAWAQVPDPRAAIHEQQVLSGGSLTATYDLVRLAFSGQETRTPLVVSAPWTIYKTRMQVAGEVVTDYRLRERWERWGPTRDLPDGPDALWRREHAILMMHPGGWDVIDEPPYNFTRLSFTAQDRTRREWEALGTPPAPYAPDGGLPQFRSVQQSGWIADAPSPPPTPVPPRLTPRFQARGVTVQQSAQGAAYTRDHALLEPGTVLQAHGQQLQDGTWAALCGPVDAQGVPEVWVLHTADDVDAPVTLLRPGGGGVLGRARFEREILRVAAGTFRRFHPSGTLTHSWPPHWALCECGPPPDSGGSLDVGGEAPTVRAVVGHDPWRDSIGDKRPAGSTDPEWWYWPGRPKRPPKVLPPDAPVAPLGLALADVFGGAALPPGGSS